MILSNLFKTLSALVLGVIMLSLSTQSQAAGLETQAHVLLQYLAVNLAVIYTVVTGELVVSGYAMQLCNLRVNNIISARDSNSFGTFIM